jgi:hypothetical protein
MMRSFSSRSDCAVIDEPFYAAYLDKTGIDHPMRDQVLQGECDPERVAERLLGPVEADVFYQKHMFQHMVDGIPRDWMSSVRNVFLIRDPARVLASYQAKREEVTMEDLGFTQQAEYFGSVADPVVIDAADILADPPGQLARLCEALGIDFDPAMLSWQKGPHKDDGVWGAHWYGRIWASTGFAPADESPRPHVDRPDIMGPAMEIYEAMRAVRLR